MECLPDLCTVPLAQCRLALAQAPQPPARRSGLDMDGENNADKCVNRCFSITVKGYGLTSDILVKMLMEEEQNKSHFKKSSYMESLLPF